MSKITVTFVDSDSLKTESKIDIKAAIENLIEVAERNSIDIEVNKK